ncbi:CGNR zinc finger domain-containing protein [Kribbella sp. NPDC051952]|uniref:CGNR zinc finger domain-containing protein n=1 Tax=Kribbella sp. NPDC051952 TaxID=3154851 RepID=UPI003448E50D
MLERLLVGETISLDLVNTEWIDRGEKVDFLAAEGAPELWLREYGFDPAEEDVDALRTSRAAIRALLDSPGPSADARMNAVLSHGYESTSVADGRPATTPTVDSGWGAAWRSARAFTELVATHPDRIRQCAHPDCVLYFYDTSRNGSRRWHSMETCGGRNKSARHYRRHVTDEKAKHHLESTPMK